jgi:hypothetical protein
LPSTRRSITPATSGSTPTSGSASDDDVRRDNASRLPVTNDQPDTVKRIAGPQTFLDAGVMSPSNPLREAWLIAVCPSCAEPAASDAAHVARVATRRDRAYSLHKRTLRLSAAGGSHGDGSRTIRHARGRPAARAFPRADLFIDARSAEHLDRDLDREQGDWPLGPRRRCAQKRMAPRQAVQPASSSISRRNRMNALMRIDYNQQAVAKGTRQ